jgi:hypothetical protein
VPQENQQKRLLLLSIVPYTKPAESPRANLPNQSKKLASDPNLSKKSFKARKKEAILERTRKCLDRGRHPTTPQTKGRSALLMASKLMKQHNLNEAEMSAESGTAHDESLAGGESIVSVTHVGGKKA